MKQVLTLSHALVLRFFAGTHEQQKNFLVRVVGPGYLFVTATVWAIGQFLVLPLVWRNDALASATIAWFFLAILFVAVAFAGIGYVLFLSTLATSLSTSSPEESVLPFEYSAGTPPVQAENQQEQLPLDASYSILEEVY